MVFPVTISIFHSSSFSTLSFCFITLDMHIHVKSVRPPLLNHATVFVSLLIC